VLRNLGVERSLSGLGETDMPGEDPVQAEIRTNLGPTMVFRRSRWVSALVKGYQEYQIVRYLIGNDQREATELLRESRAAQDREKMSRGSKIWARRVHELITDRFATAKSPRELQLAVEQTLGASLSQRVLHCRVEIC
jgi:hypothetical protein